MYRRRIAGFVLVAAMALAGCAEEKKAVAVAMASEMQSPVLAYSDQAAFCQSVSYLLARVEREQLEYEAWQRSNGYDPVDIVAAEIRTARKYGPGSAPYDEAYAQKSDSWLADDTQKGRADRHFELARRAKAAGKGDVYRYHLLRALLPADAIDISDESAVRFKYIDNQMTGTSIWSVCAAHTECPAVPRPSKATMPLCEPQWWPAS